MTPTDQIRQAPYGALYIWPTDISEHGRAFTRNLARPDIIIAPRSTIDNPRAAAKYRGFSFSDVIVDARLVERGISNAQRDAVEALRRQVPLCQP